MIDLRTWGWDARFAAALETLERVPGQVPGRVISQHRGGYRLITEAGESLAVAPGRMRHRAAGARALPAVGDWVLARPQADGPAVIDAILPRTTELARRMAGTEDRVQVLAANVDVVFVVTSLNQDLSLRRLERYLAAARESGATPVVLLSKSDLVEDAGAWAREVEAVAGGAPIVPYSAVDGGGIDEVRAHLRPGRTVVLLGSSGVGKSTLVNLLAGEELLPTQEVRAADDRGRHTTTQRMLFLLPGGSLVLDTPGMREIGLLDAEGGLGETFADVEAVAVSCRFRDCTHGNEPGCAVRAAVEAGELTAERLAAYQKLQREAAHEARRGNRGPR